jgi:hypothetical protein
MKKTIQNPYRIGCFVLISIFSIHLTLAQEVRSIDNFKKLKVHPGIDLILEQGENASVRLSSGNVAYERINTEIKGNTLQISLENYKCDMVQVEYPETPRVIAYVTFTTLEKLVLMGDGKVLSKSPIAGEKFKLKAYGEQDILMHSVETHYLKTALYGDVKLEIHAGKTERQLVKSFGDNDIDLTNLQSNTGKIRSYGDCNADLYTKEVLKVTVFGDSNISYKGNPSKQRKFVLGDASVSSTP